MTVVADNFDRANQAPLASGWTTGTTDGAFNLTGNVAVPAAIGSDSSSFYSGATWSADHSSQGRLTCTGTAGGTSGIGLCVRHAPAAKTYYRFVIDHAATNNANIARMLAGGFTSLITWTQAFTDGDLFEFRVSGPAAASVLVLFRNGVQVQTFTDNSTVATGAPGLAYSSVETSVNVNDWVGTDMVSPRATGTGTGVVTATASPVVTKPTGVVDGDFVSIAFATDTTHVLNTPAGWGLVGSVDVGTDSTLSVIWKRASAEPASWTFTNLFTVAQSGIYGVSAYSGTDPTSPVNASGTGTTTTAALKSGPAITPTVPHAMIVQYGGGDPTGAYTATPDTAPVATERFDAVNGTLGWVYCQDTLLGVAAAIALDHTASAATLATAVMEMALRPAPVPSAVVASRPPRPRRPTPPRTGQPAGGRFP